MTRKSTASEAASEAATTSEDDVRDEVQRDVNVEDNVSRYDVNGEKNVASDVTNVDVAMTSSKPVVKDERKEMSREPKAKKLRDLSRSKCYHILVRKPKS